MSDVDEPRLLLELTRDITSSLDLQEVLDRSLAGLRRIVDFDGGSIQLVRDGALQMVAAEPAATPEAYSYRLPLGQGFGGRVAVTGEPLYSPDATVDPRADAEGRAKASTAGVRSYFAAPLIVHGEPIGIVQIDSLRVDAFPVEVQRRIFTVLPIVSAAVQNALLFDQEREARLRLEEAEQMKRNFIAVVSHELRTPLTTVSGFAQTLTARAGDFSAEAVAEIGQRIERAAHRLELLISDLLDVATIERRELAVELSATQVDSILRRAAAASPHPRSLVRVEVEEGLPLCLTDPSRLGQVLARLLDNAVKFSSATSLVQVSAHRAGDRVEIAVEDEGKGIPEEMLARVFEPFYQLEPAATRSVGGMGTGLYLARELCEVIGATIDVESALGKGSRFLVRVPVAN